MNNSDLLRKLCKADPLRFALREDHSVGRWDNVLRSPVGATFLNSDYTPNTQADQWSWNALMWFLLMEQIARLDELCVESDVFGAEYCYLNERLRLTPMYRALPRFILETQIAWSECRKQEVGS
jgi:hypothetical protein